MKKRINLSSISTALKDTIFRSVGIRRIDYEEIYMLGWWITFCCLATGIGGLRKSFNFLSIYTTVLSLILVFLLLVFGRLAGEKGDKTKDSNMEVFGEESKIK